MRISFTSVRHFPDLSWIVEDLPCFSESDPSRADMLSCCCFCSGKFQSPRTEHLSSPPLLSSLPSGSSCFFLVFFCSFCFISLLLQISPFITEVKNISGDRVNLTLGIGISTRDSASLIPGRNTEPSGEIFLSYMELMMDCFILPPSELRFDDFLYLRLQG